MLRKVSSLLFCFFVFIFAAHAHEHYKHPAKQYYEIRVYHMATAEQVTVVDNYLKNALLPALRRNGIKTVGAFKAAGIDTASNKKIYLLIPYKSLNDFAATTKKLNKDKAFTDAGRDYLAATYDKPPYSRYETILLEAFDDMPQLSVPQLSSSRAERVYELRSYEGHTEKIFENKVEMFNKGGEVALFKKLGFNAVFYGSVLSGARMPNLMYMTTFENKAARDAHWKTFVDDPEWKKMSSLPQYQHNVSKQDIIFLTPTEYSDL